MWAMLLPLLSSFFSGSGPISQYLKIKADKAQADAELQLQIQKDKITMSTAIAQAEVQSEQNKLAATSQGFKTFSYSLLTLPIIIVCVAPSVGKDVFANLALIPSWYAQLYVAVVGVIWGLPVASSAVSGIFSAVQGAWLERQPVKIEKLKALNEKVLADQLRKNLFHNGMTQDQWNAILNAAKQSVQE